MAPCLEQCPPPDLPRACHANVTKISEPFGVFLLVQGRKGLSALRGRSFQLRTVRDFLQVPPGCSHGGECQTVWSGKALPGRRSAQPVPLWRRGRGRSGGQPAGLTSGLPCRRRRHFRTRAVFSAGGRPERLFPLERFQLEAPHRAEVSAGAAALVGEGAALLLESDTGVAFGRAGWGLWGIFPDGQELSH